MNINGATFGECIHNLRLAAGFSLRAFCVGKNEDPSNWSKMERGVLRPPASDARIREIGQKLGLTSQEDLDALLDHACADRGAVPDSILSNGALVAKLPFVFRTMRGESPTEDELKDLAETIRQEVTARNEYAV